jgi:acyl-CoA oxidase
VYDGNVYEELMRCAENEPLNQLPIPDGYDEFLKPMMERGHQMVMKGKL